MKFGQARCRRHRVGAKVTERDLKGNVIWQRQMNGNPHNVQRLPNGHTFITTNTQMVEVDRNGKTVWRHEVPDYNPFLARKR